MKILLKIASQTQLQCYEALSLAFALAAFDHDIQLYLAEPMVDLILNAPSGKLANMLASLDLYDLSAAWIDKECFEKLQTQQLAQNEKFAWLAQLQGIDEPMDSKSFELTLML